MRACNYASAFECPCLKTRFSVIALVILRHMINRFYMQGHITEHIMCRNVFLEIHLYVHLVDVSIN
jgi:hypothetical protein